MIFLDLINRILETIRHLQYTIFNINHLFIEIINGLISISNLTVFIIFNKRLYIL